MSITVTLIVQGLAFLAVAWLVMRFGWPEIMAAIEARRRKPKQPKKPARTKPVLVKKAVYDDFGEPVRWEWVEQPPN